MSSTPLHGPVYRLEIDYPDARLVAPDLAAPIEVADLAGPTLAHDLEAMADRLSRDGAACILALPEAEVWRNLTPDGPGAPADRVRWAAAVAFRCAPEDVEIALGREGRDGSVGAAAVRRSTLTESLAYLRRMGVSPIGITGAGEFPGFEAEPLFARIDRPRRLRPAAAHSARAGLGARLPAVTLAPALSKAKAAFFSMGAQARQITQSDWRAAPVRLSLPDRRTLQARLTQGGWRAPRFMADAAGRLRLPAAQPASPWAAPLPLAAGAVAGFALVAGLALWPWGDEEPAATAGVAAQSEAGTEVAARPEQSGPKPAAPRKDGVIFPVDEASATQIRPLALANVEPEVATPSQAAARPRKEEVAAAPQVSPVTVATRSGPAMPRPTVATEAVAAVGREAAAEQTHGDSVADTRVTVLSSRPMRRALAAPATAAPEPPVAEPVSTPEPQAEAPQAPAAQPPEAAAAPAAPAGPRPKPRATVAAAAPAPAAASPSASVSQSVALSSRIAPPEPRRIAARPAPTPSQPSTQAAVALAVAAAAAAAPKPAVAVAAPKPVVASKPMAVASAAPPAPKSAPAPAPTQVRAVAAREKVGLSRNDISLIGVFGSSNGRHALVRLPNGKVTKVERGDTIQGVQVAAIERSSVLLQGGQRSTVLKLPE